MLYFAASFKPRTRLGGCGVVAHPYYVLSKSKHRITFWITHRVQSMRVQGGLHMVVWFWSLRQDNNIKGPVFLPSDLRIFSNLTISCQSFFRCFWALSAQTKCEKTTVEGLNTVRRWNEKWTKVKTSASRSRKWRIVEIQALEYKWGEREWV